MHQRVVADEVHTLVGLEEHATDRHALRDRRRVVDVRDPHRDAFVINPVVVDPVDVAMRLRDRVITRCEARSVRKFAPRDHRGRTVIPVSLRDRMFDEDGESVVVRRIVLNSVTRLKVVGDAVTKGDETSIMR